ncbi:hypothetical protein EMCRGX_G028155 [Ephydatia muelleri]
MATLLGVVGPFNPDTDDWVVYSERLEQFFKANGISDPEKQRAVLLSTCGNETYLLIRSLAAPDKPTDKSISEILELARDHFCPSRSVIVQRYNFNCRTQKEGETVSQFCAELRRLSEYCEFGNTLNDMLRDRLVCGIRDITLQRRLLAERGLTFAKAFELAQSGRTGRKERHGYSAFHHGLRLHCSASRLSSSKKPGRSIGRDTAQRRPKDTYTLFTVAGDRSRAPLTQKVKLDGADLMMEVDTGAVASVISEETYRQLWTTPRRPKLKPSDVYLRTYTGERIQVKGQITVEAKYGGSTQLLDILVVGGKGPSLMGRDWLHKLKPNLSVCYMGRKGSLSLQGLMDGHEDLFKDELGLIKGVTVKIQVDSSKPPRFFKPRPVPYALRGRVEQELERLQRDRIIEPVHFSEWAAPVVPVMKQDGSIRICGDYKLTVNSASDIESYPLPRIDDLLSSLAGARVFTKLDLAHAYLQLALDEESKKLVTVSTHKGLFRYNRLPFGVASAPAIFQRVIEGILSGIHHVYAYMDDVLVANDTEAEHLSTLEEVLARLEQYGVRLNKAKCKFMLPSVEYLGYHISGDGVRPTQEKLQAIVDAPAPKDVSQLKSFLGLQWCWGAEQEEAFKRAKSQLASDVVLAHFDPQQLAVACDASPYGVGAVLSHLYNDGSERPIAYASRSLAPAERKYSHIEKEGLAVVFGVKKFHQYLLGRKFVVFSDHKPLQFLFCETRPVPPMASARIQRWALTLSAYNYQIAYRPSQLQANADGLSRLPLKGEEPGDVPLPGDTILMMESLSNADSVVTATTIRSWTDKDIVLSLVRRMVLHGWQPQASDEFRPYEQRKLELSVQNGCVLWGSRVVVPPQGRQHVLEMLHEGHPGISRMKSLARGIVWWPKLDADQETLVRSCKACQENQKCCSKVQLHPWEWPAEPWARVHVDFFGPFLGKQFFIIVDAHSKWIDVCVVSSPSSQQAIQALRRVFSTHGLPQILVSDNGAAFSSSEFQTFVARNGFKHVRSAPYHPTTNGLAERAVQTVKDALKKTSGDIDTRLSRFLFQYRLTLHSSTGQSPAKLLLGRVPRSHLDFLFPDVADNVKQNQQRQKQNHDQRATERFFVVGDKVYALNHRGTPTWLPGTVSAVSGSRSLTIKFSDGRESRYHADHVRAREQDGRGGKEDGDEDDYSPTECIQDQEEDTLLATDQNQAPPANTHREDTPPAPTPPPEEVHVHPQPASVEVTSQAAPILRRSTRLRHPPDRL